MKTVTHPYGTIKKVKIISIDPYQGNMSAKFKDNRGMVVTVEHILKSPKEATMCIMSGTSFDTIHPPLKVGQHRRMEFRRGGPTGGYWQILSEVKT